MAAWERLQRTGVLRGDGRRVPAYYRYAYRWMSDQMRLRLSPHHARFPLWGWYHWQGIKQCRPDLRASGHRPKGYPASVLKLSFPSIVSFFPISTPGIVSSTIAVYLSMSKKTKVSFASWREQACRHIQGKMMGAREAGWCPYLARPQLPHLRHRCCLAHAGNSEFGEPHTNQAYGPRAATSPTPTYFEEILNLKSKTRDCASRLHRDAQ